MSREVIIRIRDDRDGSDAAETIDFAYRGVSYEIDVSAANTELFDKTMKEWIEAARVVVPPAREESLPKPTKVVSAATKQQRRDIRTWGVANGFKVPERGLIAGTVIEAFLLANPGVTLLPETAPHFTVRQPALEKVSASDAEDGLISASELLSRYHDQTARDRRGERLSKPARTRIREWARANGLEQSQLGHLKREVLEAYFAAHPEQG